LDRWRWYCSRGIQTLGGERLFFVRDWEEGSCLLLIFRREGTSWGGRKFSQTETGDFKVRTSAMTLILNLSALITAISDTRDFTFSAEFFKDGDDTLFIILQGIIKLIE
jgi:hypothetical protein